MTLDDVMKNAQLAAETSQEQVTESLNEFMGSLAHSLMRTAFEQLESQKAMPPLLELEGGEINDILISCLSAVGLVTVAETLISKLNPQDERTAPMQRAVRALDDMLTRRCKLALNLNHEITEICLMTVRARQKGASK